MCSDASGVPNLSSMNLELDRIDEHTASVVSTLRALACLIEENFERVKGEVDILGSQLGMLSLEPQCRDIATNTLQSAVDAWEEVAGAFSNKLESITPNRSSVHSASGGFAALTMSIDALHSAAASLLKNPDPNPIDVRYPTVSPVDSSMRGSSSISTQSDSGGHTYLHHLSISGWRSRLHPPPAAFVVYGPHPGLADHDHLDPLNDPRHALIKLADKFCSTQFSGDSIMCTTKMDNHLLSVGFTSHISAIAFVEAVGRRPPLDRTKAYLVEERRYFQQPAAHT